MFKRLLYISTVLLMFSCVSGFKDYYTGTTGSMYGITPFPSTEEWSEYLEVINKSSDKRSGEAILWLVGTYYREGVKFNFPGDLASQNITFSNFDFNEKYLTYFNKNNIDVFLMIEPGSADIVELIRLVLEQYGKKNLITGVALDLEWYETEDKLPASVIEEVLNLMGSYNKNYSLLIKHWNINGFEKYDDERLIYIQSIEGLTNIPDINKRHKFWSRALYPNRVGVEVGFDSDREVWDPLTDPIGSYYSEFYQATGIKTSMFWNEQTLKEIIKLNQ